MEDGLLRLFSVRLIIPALLLMMTLLAGLDQAKADIMIGGAIHIDSANPLPLGLENIALTVTRDQGIFEMTSCGPRGLWPLSIPEGKEENEDG